jgi:hypothetical protein
MVDYAPEKLDPESKAGLSRQLVELNGRIRKIQDDLNDLTVERQYGPLQRAVEARNQGAPALALVELEEAERTGVSPAVVRPQLVDLYCDTGQPDKALELLGSGNVDDPSLGAEPGMAAARHARVHFLLGYYDYAARLWEDRAIPQLRYERSGRVLIAAQAFLRGQVKPATSSLLEVPGKIAQQAAWELELALCRLESGRPDLAAEPLTRSLTLAPDMALRPLAAYYLERLGKPVPPPTGASAEDEGKDKEPAASKPADQPQSQSR